MADSTSKITGIPGVGYWGGAASPTNTANKIGYLGETDRDVKNEMGKNDFLQLLAAQMQYQNPLEPQSDTDFVAQLAQFSSLESLSNMGTAMGQMANYQTYGMIGQYAFAQAYVDGVMSDIGGTIDAIYTENGVTYADISGYSVPISSINTVINKDRVPSEQSLMEYSNLIGREVTAAGTKNGEAVEVSGIVTRVSHESDGIYAHVDNGTEDGAWVPVSTIYDIKQAPVQQQDTTIIWDTGDDDGSGGETGNGDTTGGSGTENGGTQ